MPLITCPTRSPLWSPAWWWHRITVLAQRGWWRLNGANYWKPDPESSDWARALHSNETKGPTLWMTFSEPARALTGHTPATHTKEPAAGLPLETGAPAEFLLNERIFLLRADCASRCSAVIQTVLPPFVGHVFMTYNVNHEAKKTL